MKSTLFTFFFLLTSALLGCSNSNQIEITRYLNSCINDNCDIKKKWVLKIDAKANTVAINSYLKDGSPETIYFLENCRMTNSTNWRCEIQHQGLIMIDGFLKFEEHLKSADGSTIVFKNK